MLGEMSRGVGWGSGCGYDQNTYRYTYMKLSRYIILESKNMMRWEEPSMPPSSYPVCF